VVKNLDEVVAALKQHPGRPVRARLDGIDVEIRAIHQEAEMPEEEGPYAALLRHAGMGESRHRDVSRHKRKHLAQAYSPKRRVR
jgi:hypothetical protein